MAEEREAKEILSGITDDIRTIVRAEVELAKNEAMPSVKKGGIGAGLFGGAGFFAINGLSLLFIAASLALSMLIKNLWPIGFVIMGVLLLIIAALLALVGKGQIQQAKPSAPSEAAAQAKGTVEDIKAAVSRGNKRVSQPELTEGSRSPELR